MKKILIMLLAMLMLFSFTACKQDDDEVEEYTTNENSMIEIYYPTDNKVVKSEEKYQIKQPDSVSAAVEEIMLCLKEKLDESLEYHTYMLDGDNNVSLEFTSNGEYNTEYILLAKAAVVQTIFQVKDIKSVNIKITDIGGNVISENHFLRDSFYFYDYVEDETLNNIDLTFYYGGEDGETLVSEIRSINAPPNVTLEEAIINELADMGAIPSSTKVNSVSINGDICYLDLSDDFAEDVSGVKSDVVIYSVVNSIAALSNVDKVQILIDGEHVETYRETTYIYEPLEFNNDILD